MNPFSVIRIALRAIIRNKMRSFLTTLGIIIGVAAVIAMMAIGAGAKNQVEQAFTAMGTNLLILMPGSTNTGGVKGGFGSASTLTYDDVEAIRTQVASVKAAAPQLRSNQTIVGDNGNWLTQITGTIPDYFSIRLWPMEFGSAFTQQDVDTGSKVIVLGRTVVEKLFGAGANPVGQTVRVGNSPFTVIAVAGKKGQSAMGQDYDDAAFIPSSTFAQKIQGGLGRYLMGSVYIQAVSSDATARAQADVTALLRDRHRLPANSDDDFSIRNLSEIASAQQEGTETMTTLLASVAAVSLLVGGIGIMNIMLVSVTERTREIGLRMAVGAKPFDILLQFLVEALVLSLVGGALGIAFGLGIATWLASRFGWAMLVQPEVILYSSLFSATVGIVFGLYPARKASLLDPIEALRYE
jgi:putative ABC transport system permease protein